MDEHLRLIDQSILKSTQSVTETSYECFLMTSQCFIVDIQFSFFCQERNNLVQLVMFRLVVSRAERSQ
jgi:hypothetical protein